MAERRERFLVTGGAGFIGSHLVDLLLERPGAEVTVLDKLTYAGTRANLAHHQPEPRFAFVRGDVADPGTVAPLVEGSDRVIHAAAESFVDRSIEDSRAFVRSNVLGTQVVLETCRELGRPMVFVSTDEVYGSNEADPFTEDDPLRPRNPYAASKAGADLLCRSYVETYGTPVTTIRGTNAFGPRQHPEKAIPTFAMAALQGRPLPVYGDGSNRREWLYVRDFVRAIEAVMDHGEPGTAYNIGGGFELTNLELARRICAFLEVDESLITFVEDRPGHDLAYGVRWERLEALGWRPATPFTDGLATTLSWYRDHQEWVAEILAGAPA
ncbi:MAG TPA: dTDP-glucose 4,6-dehydratase [Actinomycetota bacterium]|nr:dTDP-glucose 4,6-dehydratase [Actinomycetota bacterium]